MTDPLSMPLGKQNRAARKAGLSLEEWREQQRFAAAEPSTHADETVQEGVADAPENTAGD